LLTGTLDNSASTFYWSTSTEYFYCTTVVHEFTILRAPATVACNGSVIGANVHPTRYLYHVPHATQYWSTQYAPVVVPYVFIGNSNDTVTKTVPVAFKSKYRTPRVRSPVRQYNSCILRLQESTGSGCSEFIWNMELDAVMAFTPVLVLVPKNVKLYTGQHYCASSSRFLFSSCQTRVSTLSEL
jgi:hypothetical protein